MVAHTSIPHPDSTIPSRHATAVNCTMEDTMIEESTRNSNVRLRQMPASPFAMEENEARNAGKGQMNLSVGSEDMSGIKNALIFGFRIVGSRRDPKESGTQLLMEKRLKRMSLPFDPLQQRERVRRGETPIAMTGTAGIIISGNKSEVAIPIGASDVISAVSTAGYVGTGFLRAEDYGGEASHQALLIFQREGTPPITEAPAFPLLLADAVSPLREAIVGYPQGCAGITAVNAITRVAQEHIGNIDPLLFKEQHESFIRALVAEGVHIAYSPAITDGEGMTGAYTRDPAGVIHDTFVIGMMKARTRQFETEAAQRTGNALQERGAKVLNLATLNESRKGDAILEFGDVRPLGDEVYLVGMGQTTNEEGFNLLQESFPSYTFIGVQHGELHLDLLVQVVDRKKVLINVEKLPDLGADLAKRGFAIVEADPDEPLGANVATIQPGVVIAAAENLRTNKNLRSAGVVVKEVSMSEILKKGGGPNCIMCDTSRG